jgi:cation transporter-like permease
VTRTRVGLVLVAIGVLIAVLSGLAHVIGLSFSGGDAPDTFGARQVAGVAFGVAVVLIGLVLAATGRRAKEGREGAGPAGDPSQGQSRR